MCVYKLARMDKIKRILINGSKIIELITYKDEKIFEREQQYKENRIEREDF